MMRYLICIITSMLCLSCDPDQKEGPVIVATKIDLSVRDHNGNDLLDPENVGAFKEGQIKLFYLIDGEIVEPSEGQGHLDYPKGFFIYGHENEFRISIFPNTDRNSEFPVTYIQWDEMDRDTIKCEIARTGSSEICEKVWFNENLAWKASDNTERYFEVAK